MVDKKPEPEVVEWKDAEGNRHKGSRHGSAYRDHLRAQEAATVEAAAETKTEDTAPDVVDSDPEVVADGAEGDPDSTRSRARRR